jgi:type VI secretion system ImpM family protein
MSGVGAVGLYGKVASQPDFLRVGAGAFSQAALDRWLQDGMEVLRAERTALPSAPSGFLLAPAGAPVAFVGALAPSEDAAGRSFPLAVFAEIAREGLGEALPSLPATYASFVKEAAALVSAGTRLDGSELAARALALTSAARTPHVPTAWQGEPALPLIAALGGSPTGIAYALRTLVAACDQVAKGGSPATSTITVDAPVPTPATGALWLEIAGRHLRSRDVVPSLLWTDGPDGHLLITLGPPSSTALAYLANPRHRSSRFWPLRTSVASAAERALADLTAEQRQAIEAPSATLGALTSAFG